MTAAHQFVQALHDGSAAAVGLKVPAPSATAGGTPDLDGDVADFPGIATGTGVDLAVDDDATANSGPRPDSDHVSGPLPGTGTVFGDDRNAHVVVHGDRDP